MYNNKKILILGMARSGYEVAKLLPSDNEIIITDSKDQDETKIKELEELNIKFIKTDKPEDILDNTFNLLIKNPAVFPSHPCVLKSRELNIPVVNEMEIAFHYLNKNCTIIGVTGSNGKTTTTSLIYEVLKEAQKNVYLGGNIGIPLSNFVTKIKDNDILLLEISDHQLIDFHDFKTNISVLTNVCPTHLDYHGSFENYKNTKKKIFNHHTSSDTAIINNKNEESMNLITDINSTKYYFNNEENYYTSDAIYVDNKLVINTKDILLKGTHNYENILAMFLVLKVLNIDFKYAIKVLKEFKGVEHRLEFVKTINGVSYYNDTKSTNPTSTVTALKSFDNNINLILGGMDRNQVYDDLKPLLNRVKKIYAIGEVRFKIEEFAIKNNIPVEVNEYLKDAFKSIPQNTKEGDIVLLSPGAASWDQYAKFEDRGDEFKSLVSDLK
ncbi:MAG: UDP-N-acetylmuramoyl-L-alanine--D-glutamate ligase [Ruminococcus sp.]|nr:UDP-N-acetylmuramoyl-L-alanine--D-glutamate ligase [Ruminococcus sp.]